MSDRPESLTVDDGSDPVGRILVVTAHPDDVDFAAAGSVATWTGQGIEVAYCIATDGDAGGSDHSITREFDRECRESGPLYRMGAGTCYQVGFAAVASDMGMLTSRAGDFLAALRGTAPAAGNAGPY